MKSAVVVITGSGFRVDGGVTAYGFGALAPRGHLIAAPPGQRRLNTAATRAQARGVHATQPTHPLSRRPPPAENSPR